MAKSSCRANGEPGGRRMTRFGDERSREAGYDAERSERWGKEEFFRDDVMDTVRERVAKQGHTDASWDDNDQHVASWPDDEEMPDHVLGTPDCTVTVGDTTWYTELKIKTQTFRKTSWSDEYPNYDSPSHYIDPYVVENITSYCTHEDVAHSEVLLLFAHNENGDEHYEREIFEESDWEFDIYPFDVLLDKIDTEEYTLINEEDSGYGARSYLIPSSDVTSLAEFDWES